MKPAILVLDDEEDVRVAIADYLSLKGFAVDGAATLAHARGALSASRYDAVVVDLRLPDGDGQDLIPEAREAYPDIGIIVVSGDDDVSSVVEAMRRGADNFLTKPVRMADLEVFLRRALELETLRREHSAQERLAKKEEPYFGASALVKRAMELAAIAAEKEAAVLIQGATGTGKGVLAQWLHDHSPRREQPFVELNCSTLRGDLLSSELFGHAKGAFTSAVQDREGLIDVANGGTLFLDEIGDMDPGVQAQFLKVIEEKRYRRLGESKLRASDFRLLCATSRDLEEASQQGHFRQDLFFRINVFPISLPTLKDIPSDIPGLVRHLLGVFGASSLDVPADMMQLLTTYAWPGNIRELRNVMERALLLAGSDPLSPDHFPGLQRTVRPPTPGEETWNLDELTQACIARALDHFAGNKREVARALGITPRTLYRWLKKSQCDS